MLDTWNFQDRKLWQKDKTWKNWGVQKWRDSLKQGCQNSNFNHLPWTDEIFRKGKYEEKIKFDKIWEYRNGESPSNEDAKIQIF